MKRRLMTYLEKHVPELWQWIHLPPYTSIKVTKSERRWWSCSGKNGLCFSYRLAEYLEQTPIDTWALSDSMLSFSERESLPRNSLLVWFWEHSHVFSISVSVPFIDAIIVHELAHLREKNHQKSFWNLVYQMMPEYDETMSRGKSYSTKTAP